jgi:predicted transposase YbfD/YdcC
VNQGQLHEDVKDLFKGAEEVKFFDVEHTYAKTINKNHGRIEVRECWAITDPDFTHYLSGFKNWKDLRTLIKITTHRQTQMGTTIEDRYFISSLKAPAKRLLKAVRGHWGIENGLHWVLDIAFRDDVSRVRKDHAPENLAILRHIALNLLKQDIPSNAGLRISAWWPHGTMITFFTSSPVRM